MDSLPILIRLILDADEIDQARAILDGVQRELNFKIEKISPYHKGGILAVLRARVIGHDWPHQAYASLQFAQKLAFHWLLLGGADTELELVADGNFRFPGIMWGEIQVGRYGSNTEPPEREGFPI